MNCELSEKQIRKLRQQYGMPLYVFHKNEFESNYCSLLNTVRAVYPKYNIAYSYKTNYTPRICQEVKALGGLAEVVSDMEYRLARKVGYAGGNIIYNGPVKGDGLFEHLREGGTANIDNLDELRSVVDFADSNRGLSIKLAFRVNIDIGQGFVSRFGIDAYEESIPCELDAAFTLCNSRRNIQVVGIHCHVGRSRSLEAWKNRTRILFRLIERYFPDNPEFIDFGSGMNSVMEPELAAQFGDRIPTFREYASVLAEAMKDRYGSQPENEQPWLITEPGTTLVSGCMSFLGSVKSIRNVKGKDYVTFDCSGGNMGDIVRLKNVPISVFHQGGRPEKLINAAFVGYTCLEHDHIYEGYNGELAVGDIVQFRNIGSYSNVFKPPFILPNCAMIEMDENGNTEIIKQPETFKDIFHTYVF